MLNETDFVVPLGPTTSIGNWNDGTSVTAALELLVVSTALVAVMVTVAGEGTLAGAV
jgi:hypothetical protein